MEKILYMLGLIVILAGCEALTSPNDGIPRIRSQADVNACLLYTSPSQRDS